MRILIFIMLFPALFMPQESLASEVRAIELRDGSILTGEVLSLSNGKYTIRSGSLGTVQIEESKVRAIRPAAPEATPDNATGSLKTLKDRMMNDEEVMNKILLLQNDPDFQKLIEDQEVMKAVNSFDIPSLMANPRFLKLMNNTTVREIEQKVR